MTIFLWLHIIDMNFGSDTKQQKEIRVNQIFNSLYQFRNS